MQPCDISSQIFHDKHDMAEEAFLAPCASFFMINCMCNSIRLLLQPGSAQSSGVEEFLCVMMLVAYGLREREREREIHYVQWASKAYEDESVFMSEAHLGWQ